MERFMIIGYAALMAIWLGGVAGNTGNETTLSTHLSIVNVHPIYGDSRVSSGKETPPGTARISRYNLYR